MNQPTSQKSGACRICGEREREYSNLALDALDGLCPNCDRKREVYLTALLVGRHGYSAEFSRETWHKCAAALVEMAEIVVEHDRKKP